MSIDAMKQALDALEYIYTETTEDEDELIHAAIIALRLAIEQAERQEHSIEIRVYGQTVTFVTREPMAHYKDGDRFYRHPPQRQPLTDEEIIEHFKARVDTGSLLSFADGVRFAERKHGIGE